MHRRVGYQPTLHAWMQTRVDLPFPSREVLVQMMMGYLRNNGDSEGQAVIRLSVNSALVKSVPLRDGWQRFAQ